jgi:hypothetical protein
LKLSLPADAQRVIRLERHVGQGHMLEGAVVPGQQPLGLDVRDPGHAAPEQRRRADVVGVVMRVHDVRHLVRRARARRDLIDRALEVVADGRGRVEQHHAIAGGQEGRLVGAVGDPVEVLLHLPDVVALRVERRAQRGRRDRRVVGQGVGRRLRREGAPCQGGDRGDGGDRRPPREERAAVQR